MLKRKFFLAVTIIGIAAIAGVIAGQQYAGSVVGVAKAEDAMASKLPVPPAWTDLHIAYLISETDSKYQGFAPANFAPAINAQGLANAAEAIELSRTTGLDILIIGKNSLQDVDPQWAAEQYRRGTAFVGLNITAQELGYLIGDSSFADQWGDKQFPEPFVSKALMKVSGDPVQIEAAWKAGLIAPVHDVDLLKAGFDRVFMRSMGGYGPLVSNEGSLIPDLDDIRYTLNSQNLVKP